MKVLLTIERNMRKCISVDELHSPVKNADQTGKDAKENIANNVAISSFLTTSNAASLSEHVDYRNNQAAE